MDNGMGKLLKNEDNKERFPNSASKKLRGSKRRLNAICRSLLFDSSNYLAIKTVEKIEGYVNTSEKVDRILYSEISSFIVGLDENARGTFSTNVMSLLQYVLDDENNVAEDAKKISIKIYDHFQLNLTQIESANKITDAGISKSLEKESEGINTKLKGLEKEYITILGIFAAIMLAFVGGFTFSTSVLNNIGETNIFELAIIALIIGLIFVGLISILLNFLREINDKLAPKNNNNTRINFTSKTVIVLLFILIIIGLAGLGISKIELPGNLYIGSSHYQLVEQAK